MPVFKSGGEIYHTEGSDIRWSSTRPPVLLLPGYTTTLSSFDISYPDLAKDNAYGLDYVSSPIAQTWCSSFASIIPQEWNSGLTGPIAILPSGVNHFEIEVELSRIVEPSTYIGKTIAKSLADGERTWLNGGSCEAERLGPIIRMFSFERSDDGIYLRRKQSVEDAGTKGYWAPGNSQTTGSGGILRGWTYGSNPNAWPAYLLDTRAGGSISKRRGEGNACSLVDTSDYSSLWRGTVFITPGHIKP